MPEKDQNATPPQPEPGDAVMYRSGGLTGSGALQFLIDVSENPTVATAVGGTVATAVGAKVLGSSRPKDPDPPPPEQAPPSADD